MTTRIRHGCPSLLRWTLYFTVLLEAIIMFRLHHRPMITTREELAAQSHTLAPVTHLEQQQHQRVPTTTTTTTTTLDILSIGSLSRLNFLETQQSTFAALPQVRHFFNATEVDDFDPTCNARLTSDDVTETIQFCRRFNNNRNGEEELPAIQRDISKYFMPRKWMAKKSNPVAWLCAQQRPLAALSRVMATYQSNIDGATALSSSLPDYLMVIDDDTYIQPAAILGRLQSYERRRSNHSSSDTPTAAALTGCTIQLPSQFTFAHGGFGIILSKEILIQLLEPIHEDSAIFHGILANQLGEARTFASGMNLLDLFASLAKRNLFVNHTNWTFPGYCMHSDWVLGYMLGMIGVAIHPLTPETNLCAMNGEKCMQAALHQPIICHYATPRMMQRLHVMSK